MTLAVCNEWVSFAQLVLTPFVLAAAVVCVLLARRYHSASGQAAAATRNAVLLTTRIVAHTAAYLECEVCGARLDTRVGVGIGLDPDGQLRLRCGEHQEAEL